jgi:cytochrome c6
MLEGASPEWLQGSYTVKLNLRNAAIICLAASVAAPAFAQSAGADTYKANCLMCHGADGLGATPIGKSLNIVSFKDPTAIKSSDAALIAIVKKGKNKMPPYTGKLTDAQIKSAIGYIRTLQSS